MVCSSSPLASNAGLEILAKGGNAVDAAVATAAVMAVVEPTSNGLGSDAFAIVWMKDQIYGLNASGRSPENISIEKVKALGYDTMPKRGWIPVMVPGAPKAWASLISRFGKLSLKEVLAPAIRYAENGFTVSPVLSFLWNKYVNREKEEYGDRQEFREWKRVFTKQGKAPAFGEIVRFPDHARSLRLIAETEAKAFYEGEIAEKIVAQSLRDGGFFTMDDFKNYDVEWVDPISVNYRGYDVWEIPPNGQGIVALMALNMLKNFDFGEKEDIDTYHKQIEAIKIAFAEAKHHVTDPRKMIIDYHDLLRKDYGRNQARLIREQALLLEPVEVPKSGTVYLCTADGQGNMVSYIQSNYMGFGSGIVLEGYGVSLQNRGADFSLDPHKANALEPHKKSYHTIIPGFLTKDGKAIGPFGVMGGYMQPQGHLQVLMNLIDFGLNPQMALDAPRWQWLEGKRVTVEPEFPKELVQQLCDRGHEVTFAANRTSFGRGQIIWRLENGVLVGGTESRTDSNIACY